MDFEVIGFDHLLTNPKVISEWPTRYRIWNGNGTKQFNSRF